MIGDKFGGAGGEENPLLHYAREMSSDRIIYLYLGGLVATENVACQDLIIIS